MSALIFDWSGTLSDNFHCFCYACDRMFAHFGRKPIAAEEIRANSVVPYMRFWNKYFPELSQEEEEALYARFIGEAGDAQLYPGVIEALSCCAEAGVDLFIVSSDPAGKLREETAGVKGWFRAICGGVHEKEQAITSLLQEFRLAPQTTYYVGDTTGDIAAGKLAGVKTVAIGWGFQSEAILRGAVPDFFVSGIAEIGPLLGI